MFLGETNFAKFVSHGKKNFAKLLSQTSFDGYILGTSVFVTLSVFVPSVLTYSLGFYSSPRYGFADGRYG